MTDDTPALTEAEQEALFGLGQPSLIPGSTARWVNTRDLPAAVERILAGRVSTATGDTAGDDLRDRVTALAEAGDRETNWYGHTGYVSTDDLRVALSASSAPVVSRPETEVKAEALTEAADDAVPRFSTVPLNRSNTVADWLRARAASLAADPEGDDQ